MIKKLISLAVAALFRPAVIRSSTRDVAFQFRMGAGFPGDVNRTHPVSIEPVLIDEDDPPAAYGFPVLVDATTHGVRGFVAGDTAVDTIWGVTVRPYPTQQQSGGMSADFGSATPPETGTMDVMRSGYIMVKLPVGQAPVKGGAVFIWCAVSSGAHIQGGFEDAASGGNTAALDPEKYQFNGGADANGNVEISVNV